MKWIPNDLKAKYKGEWALVTGASDGIGLAMCKHLAEKYGFNIIMVSRSKQRLENAQEEVRKASPNCQIKIFEVDFSKITKIDEYYKVFDPLFQENDISIVINNAGVPWEGQFH